VKVPAIEITAKDGLSKPTLGQFSVKILPTETGYDSILDMTSKDLSVTVRIWNEDSLGSLITIFSGRAYLGAKDKDNYTYQLKVSKDEISNDLLLPAPDIRQNAYLDADKSFYFETVDQGGNWSNTYLNNRVFPVRLGVLKHIPIFVLANNAPVAVPADSVGEYYTDGSTYALYDNGLKINYENFTSEYRVTKNKAATNAVYEVTCDVDGDDTAAKSATSELEVLPLGYVFRQASEPLETAYELKVGMLWYDTDNNDKTYRYDATSWVDTTVTVTNDIVATDAIDTINIVDAAVTNTEVELDFNTLTMLTTDDKVTPMSVLHTSSPNTWNGSIYTILKPPEGTRIRYPMSVYSYNNSSVPDTSFKFSTSGASFANVVHVSSPYGSNSSLGWVYGSTKIAQEVSGTSDWVIEVWEGSTQCGSSTTFSRADGTSLSALGFANGTYGVLIELFSYNGGLYLTHSFTAGLSLGTGKLYIIVKKVTTTDVIRGYAFKYHSTNINTETL
jgi:hypothetical protein